MRAAATAGATAVVLLFAASPASAAVVADASGTAVTVTTDGPAVAVSCGGDTNVKVNGADPTGGPLACAAVTSLEIGASAPATIDLGGVTAAEFTAPNPGIQGSSGADTIVGSDFADVIDGNGGADTLGGGGGDDTYLVSGGSAAIDDASGDNSLDFSSAAYGVTVDLSQSAGQVQAIDSHGTTLGLTGTFDSAVGSSFDDVLIGSAADDVLSGGPGNDTLGAWSGHDTLDGDDGADTYEIYSASDVAGAGGPTVATVADSGGSGTDALRYYGTSGGDAFTIRSSIVANRSESVSYSGIEGTVGVYGFFDDQPSGTGDDLFAVVSAPAGGVVLDGEDGSDAYTVHFGSLLGNVQIVDSGSAGSDLLAVECGGTTFGSGTLSNAGRTVSYSGVETLRSCDAAPPASSAVTTATTATATTSTGTTTTSAPAATPAPSGTRPPAGAAPLVVQLLGAPFVGRTVWALANAAPDAVTYEWQLCKGKTCTALRAAKAAGIRIQAGWTGKQLRVVVRSRAAAGTAKTAPLRRL
jgi:hypothetical protein